MSYPDIMSPEYEKDPNPFLHEMLEEHPVYYHEGLGHWIISRHADVERALKSPVFTTKNYAWQLEPVHGKTILQVEGSDHRRMRAIINPALRGEDLRTKFVPVIDRCSQELIDMWSGDGQVDFVKAYTERFPVNVITEMLGLDQKDEPIFYNWYKSIIAFFSNISGDEEIAAQGIRTRDELAEYMYPIIEERRAEPGEDLLSTIVHADIGGEKMDDYEIKCFVSFVLVAAAETTDKSMANMFLQLIQHPEQMQAVQEDRSLIRAAFAETLRHTPPVLMVMREPDEDVEFQGVKIPAGSTVTAMCAAANRDPRVFKDPDDFNIFRTDLNVDKAFGGGANHMTFALGRHFCVGSILAMYEVERGTNQLLDAMEDIEFTSGQPPQEIGNFVRSPVTMPINFTPTGKTSSSNALSGIGALPTEE